MTAAFTAVAVVAPMAQGTGSVDRVAALEKKVKALQKQVASLATGASATRADIAAARSEIGTVKTDVGAVQQSVSTLQTGATTLQLSISTVQSNLAALTTCVRYRVLPISQYDGYLFTSSPPTMFTTTALDVTDQGQTPGAYVAVVNPSCVGSANNALRLHSQSHTAETLHLR
jgi:uncharacterized protein YoxC